MLNSLFLFFPFKKKKTQLNSSHSINRVHYNIGKHGKYLRFWHSLSQGPLCAVCQFFFFFPGACSCKPRDRLDYKCYPEQQHPVIFGCNVECTSSNPHQNKKRQQDALCSTAK